MLVGHWAQWEMWGPPRELLETPITERPFLIDVFRQYVPEGFFGPALLPIFQFLKYGFGSSTLAPFIQAS